MKISFTSSSPRSTDSLAASLSKHVASFVAAIVLALTSWSTCHAEVSKKDAVEPTAAEQLASSYNQDQKAADAQYAGKKISIKGVVCKIQQGENKTLAYVYLQTGPLLPLVKLEVTAVEKFNDELNDVRPVRDRISLNTRFVNDSMEARLTKSIINRGGRNNGRVDKDNGPWQSIVKCGDAIVAKGTCKGKFVGIVITDATI